EVDPPDLHPEPDLLDCGHAGDVGLGGPVSAEYGVDAARVEEAVAIRPHTDGRPWALDGALSEPVPDRAEVDRFPGQSLTPCRLTQIAMSWGGSSQPLGSCSAGRWPNRPPRGGRATRYEPPRRRVCIPPG